jgi:hypothetical protein
MTLRDRITAIVSRYTLTPSTPLVLVDVLRDLATALDETQGEDALLRDDYAAAVSALEYYRNLYNCEAMRKVSGTGR